MPTVADCDEFLQLADHRYYAFAVKESMNDQSVLRLPQIVRTAERVTPQPTITLLDRKNKNPSRRNVKSTMLTILQINPLLRTTLLTLWHINTTSIRFLLLELGTMYGRQPPPTTHIVLMMLHFCACQTISGLWLLCPS